MDLTASILAATRTPVPADARLEGIDLLPMLEGRAQEIERTLFWRVTGPRTQVAVRSGDWKLLFDGRPMLFNLRADLGERNNLIGQRGDIARQLEPLLAAWQKDVDAEAEAWDAATIAIAMQYLPYARVRSVPNVIVDGARTDNTLLTLSHWPKSGTPAELNGDTSTEIVFNYLDTPKSHVEADAVSNNHFDEDGLVGIFAMLEPTIAQRHRDLLVDVAQAATSGSLSTVKRPGSRSRYQPMRIRRPLRCREARSNVRIPSWRTSCTSGCWSCCPRCSRV